MIFVIVLFHQIQANITLVGCSEIIVKKEKNIKSPYQRAFLLYTTLKPLFCPGIMVTLGKLKEIQSVLIKVLFIPRRKGFKFPDLNILIKYFSRFTLNLYLSFMSFHYLKFL